MKKVITRTAGSLVVLGTIVVFSACHRAKMASTPSPALTLASPSASLTARAETIEKGQSSTLSWKTANATQVSIDTISGTKGSLGPVEPNGARQVNPFESTTYILDAMGPGGTGTASVRITVIEPPAPAVVPAQATDDELFANNVRDVYFDLDNTEIRSDQKDVVRQNAAFLTQHPIALTIEGHCDERGSIEYNLALGDQRASSLKQALAAAGVNSANINTVTYGKERPVCVDHNEPCWQQNRRGHFNHANTQTSRDE